MYKMEIIGNLTADPTVRTVGSKTVANFDVAVKVSKEKSEFIKCTLWAEMAENAAKYLKKGSKVYISGNPFPEFWEDKEGVIHTKINISVYNIEYLSSKNDEKNRR